MHKLVDFCKIFAEKAATATIIDVEESRFQKLYRNLNRLLYNKDIQCVQIML